MEYILPCHPQLRDDEEFSFWLLGLAAAHGLSAEELLHRVGCPGFDFVDGWKGINGGRARIYSTICSTRTGIPIQRLRAAMLCELAGLLGNPADTSVRHYDVCDPWITQHMKGQLRYAGEFCPLCLLESPHFRLSWRISLFVSCSTHGCLLAHLCGSCGEHFDGFKHLSNLNLSGWPDIATTCPQCSGQLAAGNPITPVPPEVRRIEALHRVMVRDPRCISYFTGLHSLLRLMGRDRGTDCAMSQAVRAKLADTPWEWEEQPPRYERCEPIQRQYLLQAVSKLFRSWPTVFVDVIRSCKISSWAIRTPPPWMLSAIHLAHGYEGLEIETVQSKFWKAAEAEGWYEAAEILNGAPRSAIWNKKKTVKPVKGPTSEVMRATSHSD